MKAEKQAQEYLFADIFYINRKYDRLLVAKHHHPHSANAVLEHILVGLYIFRGIGLCRWVWLCPSSGLIAHINGLGGKISERV